MTDVSFTRGSVACGMLASAFLCMVSSARRIKSCESFHAEVVANHANILDDDAGCHWRADTRPRELELQLLHFAQHAECVARARLARLRVLAARQVCGQRGRVAQTLQRCVQKARVAEVGERAPGAAHVRSLGPRVDLGRRVERRRRLREVDNDAESVPRVDGMLEDMG